MSQPIRLPVEDARKIAESIHSVVMAKELLFTQRAKGENKLAILHILKKNVAILNEYGIPVQI